MRPVRYNVAASLDGFIAGPKGEFDWIPEDSTIDFAAIFEKIDTVLLGRRTYELTLEHPEKAWNPGTRLYVFSRTMRPAEHPGVTIVATDAGQVVAGLRAEQGSGEIWLFGGGVLFRSLLDAGQVDRIEVTVAPVLLGAGIPLLPPGQAITTLSLTGTKRYPSGMVTLSYDVPGAAPSV